MHCAIDRHLACPQLFKYCGANQCFDFARISRPTANVKGFGQNADRFGQRGRGFIEKWLGARENNVIAGN